MKKTLLVMKALQAIACIKGFAKRFPFIALIVLHPLLLCAAGPGAYVTNNRSDSMTIINTATDEVLILPIAAETLFTLLTLNPIS